MNTGDHMTPAVCRHHWLLSLRVGSLNCRSKLSEVNPQLLKDFQTIPIFFVGKQPQVRNLSATDCFPLLGFLCIQKHAYWGGDWIDSSLPSRKLSAGSIGSTPSTCSQEPFHGFVCRSTFSGTKPIKAQKNSCSCRIHGSNGIFTYIDPMEINDSCR